MAKYFGGPFGMQEWGVVNFPIFLVIFFAEFGFENPDRRGIHVFLSHFLYNQNWFLYNQILDLN